MNVAVIACPRKRLNNKEVGGVYIWRDSNNMESNTKNRESIGNSMVLV